MPAVKCAHHVSGLCIVIESTPFRIAADVGSSEGRCAHDRNQGQCQRYTSHLHVTPVSHFLHTSPNLFNRSFSSAISTCALAIMSELMSPARLQSGTAMLFRSRWRFPIARAWIGDT